MAAHESWSERVASQRTVARHRQSRRIVGAAIVVAAAAAAVLASAPWRPDDGPDAVAPFAPPAAGSRHLVEGGEIESAAVTPVFTRSTGEVVWMADDGSDVAADDPVLRLDETDPRKRLEDAERQIVPRRTDLARARTDRAAVREVASLRVRLAEVQLAKAEWAQEELKLKPTRDEKAAAKLDARVAAQARERATRDLGRFQELVGRGLATDAELRQKKLDQLDAEANAYLAELRLEAVMRGPTELELEAAKLQIEKARLAVEEARALGDADGVIAQKAVDVAELRLAKSESSIEQIREELAECTVRAPSAGRIAFVEAWKGSQELSPVRVGETCRHGQLVAKIADASVMRAVVIVNEVDALRLTNGMTASVRLTAYPGMRIAGRVSYIAARAIDKNERLGNLALRKAGKAGVNVVEVHVRLDRQPADLRGGHTATVSIDLQPAADADGTTTGGPDA